MAKICKNKSVITYSNRDNNSRTLEQLVKGYLMKKCRPGASDSEISEQELHREYLDSLMDMVDYICGQPNFKNGIPEPDYTFDSHQWHLKFPTRIHVVKDMMENLNNIDKIKFQDFEQLRDYVYKNRVTWFGNTCVYDFSLRYGHKQNPKIEPKTFVYVHTHPLISARYLSELGYISSKVENSTYRIPLEDFSSEILQPGMTAADIEHFLCIYKDEILRISK